jgi:hypothetical protein
MLALVAAIALAPCHSPQLDLRYIGRTGATGHWFESLVLRPKAGVRCTLRGYPGVSLLDRRGAPLPVRVHRDRLNSTVRTLTFDHRHPARFYVSHPTINQRTMKVCRLKAYAIRVIPPNETQPLTVATGAARPFCRSGALVIAVRHNY